MNARNIALIAALGLTVMACDKVAPKNFGDSSASVGAAFNQPQNVAGISYRATEQLAGTARPALDAGSRVLIASLADIDDLDRSSTFGRMVGEQVSSRMAQLGYAVQEIRLRNSLMIKDGTGELILSRDLNRIGRESNAQAIVAGTYAVGGQWIYVTLRLIGAGSGQVLSSVDFVVPVDRDTSRLVAQPASLGREVRFRE
jgi:TolB-like protein